MHKYHFTKEVRQTLAGLPLPIAFYQFLDHRVVPLLLSQGFLDFFGIKEMAEGIDLMANDMYRDTQTMWPGWLTSPTACHEGRHL